ncbi:MAG: glycerol-3-phosphate 1-O-acyltransferase PlsY [Desulfobacterota bacterium]|nr:glycerol-3-phosphate 1-O-acyltransferase PlsY [Thermodesulfobacteriota bacterium]MDW8001557.1 glycerol-3-phosphate 1-O-acyltransferase PlsY [Deltaproteobacteria bacterium]
MGDPKLYVFYLSLSYLLGSIPFGLILSKLKGVDPRKVGSGNIGATNVMRAVGKRLGFLTLLCDLLKAGLPVLFGRISNLDPLFSISMGFASFLGHSFPIWLKFRGGKGVAPALGAFLFFNPHATLYAIFIFVFVFFLWRYVSLASLVSSFSFPFILFLLGERKEVVFMASLFVALIFLRHRENIRRLKEGRENRVNL